MTKRTAPLLFVLLILAVLLTSCSGPNNGQSASGAEQGSEKISFTDLSGREITLDKRPEKIIVANFIANYLMIGGEENLDKVVGLPIDGWQDTRYGEYTVYTQAFPKILEIESIGGYHDNFLNTELIVSLQPDVIIMSPSQYTDNNSSISTYENAGIAVVVLDYHGFTLEKHTKSTEILGLLLGREDVARELNDTYTSAIEDLQAQIATLPDTDKHKKMYVELGNKGTGEYGYSYPNDRLWGAIMHSLEIDNIGSGLDTYAALDKEFVVTSDPDIIVIAGSIWAGDKGDQMRMGFTIDETTAQARLQGFAERPEWKNLKAVQAGEIYGVDHGGLCMMSDYAFIQYIAKIAYPQLFADLDSLKNLNDFYATYLPEIDIDGTYMIKLK